MRLAELSATGYVTPSKCLAVVGEAIEGINKENVMDGVNTPSSLGIQLSMVQVKKCGCWD